jgi:hypothetical protein
MNQDRKPNPEYVRRDFCRLKEDWELLRANLPKPVAQENGRRQTWREYGHPAEWASDKARQIADLLNSWHDLLAEHRNEHRPPPATAAEETRVRKAWQYLEPRIEQLVELVEPESLREIADLHREIRTALGYNTPKKYLPFPCPSIECGEMTLTEPERTELIYCESCRRTAPKQYRQHLFRAILADLVHRID